MPEIYEQSLVNLKESELRTQLFFYEIHVKSKLSEEKWTSWFDNLKIDAKYRHCDFANRTSQITNLGN